MKSQKSSVKLKLNWDGKPRESGGRSARKSVDHIWKAPPEMECVQIGKATGPPPCSLAGEVAGLPKRKGESPWRFIAKNVVPMMTWPAHGFRGLCSGDPVSNQRAISVNRLRMKQICNRFFYLYQRRQTEKQGSGLGEGEKVKWVSSYERSVQFC